MHDKPVSFQESSYPLGELLSKQLFFEVFQIVRIFAVSCKPKHEIKNYLKILTYRDNKSAIVLDCVAATVRSIETWV